MSTQRPVSSTRASSPSRLIAAFVLGAAVGAGGSLLVERGRPNASPRRVTLQANAPTGSMTAAVTELPCGMRTCQQLSIGQSSSGPTPRETMAVVVETLETQTATEIAWTSDAKRVGFVIDGHELWIYDVATNKLAGRVGLMTADAAQVHLARGVTFSENGRAVTFDDCPRKQSGCRAGVVGIPQ